MTAPTDETLRIHLEHFRRRVLTDALLEGTATYWERRAGQFAAVGTPACDAIAEACSRHADLLRDVGLDQASQAVIDDILLERHGQVA